MVAPHVHTEYDRQYDPIYLVPDGERYLKWYADASTSARQELPCSLNIQFGPGRDEVLDIFPSSQSGSPILVFVHGGYWQSTSSRDYSFVARGLHAHGITVVVTNYSLCPAVTISDITRQTRAALGWIHREAHRFNGDPRRIFVAGHSAGGQQVGMLLATSWTQEYGLPQDLLKGAITISGIFDLGPLRRCSMQQTLRLTPELVQDQSPQFHIPEAGPPLLASFGGNESAEFRRQSTDYLQAWKAKGLPGRLLVQPGRNHFDAIIDLSDAKSQLGDAVMAVIAQPAPVDGPSERPPRSTRRILPFPAGLPTPGSAGASDNRAGSVVPIAGASAGATRTSQAALSLPIESVPRREMLPTSFAQHRLWYLVQLAPTSQVYNEPIMVHMDERVDPALLQECLTEITRRHEAWRTTIPSLDGEPRQQVAPPRPFPLDVVDLRSLSPDQRESEVHRIAAEHARRPFDLREGPLVRALLIVVGEKESRLVVTAHHIVVDGVSFFSVFLPELSALYAAFARRQPSPLPEPSLHYADFACWQRHWLSEEVLRPKLAYWRVQLGKLSDLPLPTDFPRPPVLTDHGARAPVAISAELTRQLRELGHQAGVSLFTTLLAAWKTLLFRYTAQSDIVVGSAAAGRPRPEFEGLIGFFNNILLLRTQLDGSLTFRELLTKVGEVLRDAREHQDVPFDRLVTELGAGRGSQDFPIYNNIFLLMPPLPRLEQTPGWSASRFELGTAKTDLYFELHQRPAGLCGHLEYRTQLFSAATIAQMIGHFTTLLESIARDPGQRLAQLALLTAKEQRTLAQFQGPTLPPLPDEQVLGLEQLFAAQAARFPEAIALEQGDTRITYAELDARTNRLAQYLRQQGVKPDTLVGLCIERSVDAMVAILGVLKAGGAYVPLDPSYPAERLHFMIADASIELLLTNQKSARAVPEYRGRMVLLDENWPTIASYGAQALAPLATARHLAYVIYTSGSTGRPKGVLVERRGLYYLAKAQEKMFGLGAGSRILQFFSISFDGSVWDFTLAWAVGATLVLAPPEAVLPGPLLAEFLANNDIHLLTVTPSALTVTPYRKLPALHTIISAGEALPAELVERWAPGRRFFNAAAPTETTVASIATQCRAGEGKPLLGRPFDYVSVYVLDSDLRPTPIGVPGELYIGGPGVARGYLGRAELTQSRFIPSPFPDTAGTCLYKTGDRVKWCADGQIDYLGRLDRQVKLRGFRIELGEIEAVLEQHPAVQQAKVVLEERPGNDARILAYIVPDGQPASSLQGLPSSEPPRRTSPSDLSAEVMKFARAKLPTHMVPAAFLLIDRLPVLPNGKVDFKTLAAAEVKRPSDPLAAVSLHQTIAAIWREVLGIEEVGADDPFFAIGGHSLALTRVQAKLAAQLGVEVDIVTLMRLPTVRQLAVYLAPKVTKEPSPPTARLPAADAVPAPHPDPAQLIAIVGMAIRAPGAHGIDSIWEVIQAGRETISFLDPEALIRGGADPARVRRPEFVPAAGVLERADHFDAAFFGYSEADAACMDPQRRMFLECAYEALEHAGCDPARFKERIGVFGGCGTPLHWMGPVTASLRSATNDPEWLRAQTLNGPDFLATGVAFKLGLRGPALTVQTACSTSLSAVHLARRSLLAGECEVALAGGSSITSLSEADRGYLGVVPGTLSADGHCRPFDAEASGMVMSSGVAIVVMKRLAAALADGDTIHAVIIGSAMNNDGSDKLGFTAPSENGVTAVVEQACEAAGVDPASIGFVEAHGTGTRLGDPTEVRALSRAFRRWTQQQGFCALGSLKGNLGHLDTSAGAAGLIKATLALSHELIPPQSGFRVPNPLLELPSTPFFVNSAPLPWPRTSSPRRAGVNAMGIGGTNVHVLLQEAPPAPAPGPRRPVELLCISARTETALSATARRLSEYLEEHPTCSLADVAYTLSVGRTQHGYRSTVVAQDVQEAIAALAGAAAARPKARRDRPVVLLFPGHGTHYLRMGIELYETDPAFRAEVDQCFDIAREVAGLELAALWRGELPDGERQLDEIPYAQTLLFTIEYSLAKRLLAWGIRPAAMLGHSLGEYVAACVAGVFSVRDALALVAVRGRLIASTPAGSMFVAFAEPPAVEPHLGADVAIATYAPGNVVLSGLADAVDRARRRLLEVGIETSSVRASRAGHSPVMRAVRDAFRCHVAEVELRAPTIPIVSNLTGRIMTVEQALSPDAWADHLCSPVRLAEGLGAIIDLGSPVCLELGPGSSLGSSLKRHSRFDASRVDVTDTLPDHRKHKESAYKALLRGLGRAWEFGVELDWEAFHAPARRRRIPLPTYPFEGRKFVLGAAAEKSSDKLAKLDLRAVAIAQELGVRGVDEYPGLRSRLTALCATLVLDFFGRQLGDGIRRGFSLESLQGELRILPSFAKMLEAFVSLLEHQGLASRSAAGEILLQAPAAGRSAELTAGLIKDYSGFAGLVRLIGHCAGHYGQALTGGMQPIGVVFPDGTDALLRSYMRDNVAYRYDPVYLALTRELVLDMVAQRAGRKTRILEIGAGHGTLTWPLIESLKGADVEYHFTDISRSFLQRAEAAAAERNIPWLKSFRFDLNLPPAEQGIRESYDIILGFNVVHVARDPAAALKNLHDLLAPSGALALVVCTRLDPWNDLVFGLSPGYWDAAAHSRGEASTNLLFWEELLRRCPYSQVMSVPGPTPRGAVEDHGLLIAKQGGGVAPMVAPSPGLRAPAAAIQTPRATLDAAGALAAPARPSDDAEQTVRSTWMRLLGLSQVSPDASFFELGGDSLLAVQLLAELRAKTGHEIKMRQLVDRPTVAGLTAILRGLTERSPAPTNEPAAGATRQLQAGYTGENSKSSRPDCLLPLQPAGTKRPLFFVHPIGGSALCYAALARSIDPQRPFFGLQSPMLEDGAARPDSIEELASRYVAAIVAVQPTGPYLLGGFSFGGVVAIEVARQLQQGGQAVAKLVLLDAIASPAGWLAGLHRIDERLAVAALLPAIFAASARSSAAARDPLSHLSEVLGVASKNTLVYGHHLALWQKYTPKEVDLPAVHFVAAKKNLGMRLLSATTRTLPLRRVRVVPISGNHGAMLSPAEAPLLGARIKDVLDAADPPPPSDSPRTYESDDASVRAVVRELADRMSVLDGAGLVQNVWANSDSCSLIPAFSDPVVGTATVKETYIRSISALSDARVRFHDERVLVFAHGKAAYVTALLDTDLVYGEGGQHASHRNVRVSLSLEKQDCGWRVLSAHYSKPVNAHQATGM